MLRGAELQPHAMAQATAIAMLEYRAVCDG
jgi:hypothetical protein